MARAAITSCSYSLGRPPVVFDMRRPLMLSAGYPLSRANCLLLGKSMPLKYSGRNSVQAPKGCRNIRQMCSVREREGTLEGAEDDLTKEEKACAKETDWNHQHGLRRETEEQQEQQVSYRFRFYASHKKAETAFFRFSGELGKYTVLMFGTGVILASGFSMAGGDPHLQSVLWASWFAGIILGSMIGTGQALETYSRAGPRKVLITGSTRGLGKALAREFLHCGDSVVIASRSERDVASTVQELQAEAQLGQKVVGLACDVANSESVRALADLAVKELGRIDLWINNAGTNTGAKPLLQFEDEELQRIVSTNLVGSLICTREAVRLMMKQPKGGHVFNMDGAGSGGGGTPRYAAYGATKCGLRQLQGSLLEETKGTRVGVHTASPGMVLTDLLLSGATLQNKQMFNIVCEQPETVARALVPKMRLVRGTGKAFNYLTPLRVILAIMTAWIRRGRWFDAEGQAVYAAEAERLTAWARGPQKSPVTAAMELVPGSAWLSLFSSSAICAYIMLFHNGPNVQ